MSYYKRLVNANKRATAKCMSISLPAMMKVQGKGKKQCDDVKFPTNVLMQTAVTDEKKKQQRKSIRFPKADLAAHLKESVPEAQCENEAAILALLEKHSAKSTDYKVVNDALANSTNYDSLLHLAASKNYLKFSVPVEEQRKSTLCIYRKSTICPTQVTEAAEAKSERLPMRKCWNYSARPRIGANCV